MAHAQERKSIDDSRKSLMTSSMPTHASLRSEVRRGHPIPMQTSRPLLLSLLLLSVGCRGAEETKDPALAAAAPRRPGQDAPKAPAQAEAKAVEPQAAATVTLASDPAQAETDLAQAQARYADNPTDEEAIVWLGRRLGYVGRYEEAVETFSKGLELHPDSARLLRFRGHRYITLRRFEDAVKDLERAQALSAGKPDEPEPDGKAGVVNGPIETLHSAITYHLGLAHYLLGDFERALAVYQAGAEVARAHPDRTVSLAYWTWLTLGQLGRGEEAQRAIAGIDLAAPLGESFDYRDLLRCFRGELSESEVLAGAQAGSVSEATRCYGLAMQRKFRGDEAGARELWTRAAAGMHAAFGCIASEVELAR
jgi:tetratricopeptide (TPR) repeat protein